MVEQEEEGVENQAYLWTQGKTFFKKRFLESCF